MTLILCACAAGVATAEDDALVKARIEREVAAACREIDARQAKLSDRCSLADYRALVRAVNGTNMWTAALQKALGIFLPLICKKRG